MHILKTLRNALTGTAATVFSVAAADAAPLVSDGKVHDLPSHVEMPSLAERDANAGISGEFARLHENHASGAVTVDNTLSRAENDGVSAESLGNGQRIPLLDDPNARFAHPDDVRHPEATTTAHADSSAAHRQAPGSRLVWPSTAGPFRPR